MKNMQTVLLAVKETEEIIQEGDGGIRYLTQADFAGAGGGGTGDASAANQTSVQAIAGSDASKAVAIQGITGGKPIPVTVDGVVGGFSPQEADNFEIGSFNGAGSYIFSTSNKGTLKLLIGVEAPTPPAIFLSAPILEVIANGTENWRPLEDIDPSYVPLTTDTVQSRVLDVTAYSSVRISFNVSGGIGYQATTSRLISQVEVKRLLGNIATSVGNISVGSEQGLHIEYDNITNCPVSPANSVSAWNTYFSTDTVQKVTVVGNKVILVCNGQFSIGNNIKHDAYVKFQDFSGYVISIGTNFLEAVTNANLTDVYLPNPNLELAENFAIWQDKLVNVFVSAKILKGFFLYYAGNLLKDIKLDAEIIVGVDDVMSNLTALNILFSKLKHIKAPAFTQLTCESLVLPELQTTADECFKSITVSKGIYLDNLAVAGTNFLSSLVPNIDGSTIISIPNLKSVGAGSFTGISGKTFTVHINKHFATTNSEFLAFLSANPSVVVVYTDTDTATQTNQYLIENVCQTVSFTNASSTASAGFNANTKRILVTPTEDCWIKLGGTATAGGSSFFVSAGIPFPPILLNGKTSLSVIGKATSGQLSIFESL